MAVEETENIPAVAVKFAVEEPAATVTEFGTKSGELLLDRPTAAPPLGAGPESVIVQDVNPPGPRLVGLHARLDKVVVVTVNCWVLLVPPDVVTLTKPLAALPPMLKVAVICVELTKTTLLGVIPLDTLIVAMGVKPVPVRVTGTDVPCAPLAGFMEVRVGTGVLENVTGIEFE